MASVPTVAIACPESDSGYCLINQSEYDAEVHSLWSFEAVGMSPVHEPDSDDVIARALELARDNSVTALRKVAKEWGVSGYSKMDEQEVSLAIARAELDKPDGE